MNNSSSIARLAGFGLSAAVIGCLSAAPVHADTIVPLPGGHITQTIGDGTVVDVDLTGESANINPSLGATPLHRNAWTSGHGAVDLSGGAAADPATYTKLNIGYIVGCQVDLSAGMTAGVDASATADLSSGQGTITPSGGASTSLTLAAGQAKVLNLLDLEVPDDYNKESHYSAPRVSGPHQSVTWHDETFAVNGCGGYAQARSFVQAKVYTPTTVGMVTLWGEPFSLG
ncbi:MspA family porin [Nocardia sp. NPDC059240]|uniref:MspA family porin n=1 Tax=Nocardia sp. NPDC059240 TaxID=3346786 RepID=UPI0036B379E0